MKKLITILAVLAAMSGLNALAESGPRIGAGVNYWVALDDLDEDDVDDDGFSYIASYQYRADLLGLEVDVEFLPDRFGEDAWAPEAYLLLGRTIYAGAGIGIVNSDGDFADEPFYAFKAGLDLEVLPSLYLDISANYRFNDSADLGEDEKDIDTDTVFLGAAIRVAL